MGVCTVVQNYADIATINPFRYRGYEINSITNTQVEETVNAFMCIETVAGERDDVLDIALDELKALIESELGGKVEKHVLSKSNPEVVISL